MKYLRYIGLLVVTISLNSCAMFYDVQVDKPEKYVAPKQIDLNFDVNGRFSIKSSNKNSYGNFTWNRTPQLEVLELNTPIGETVARLTIESDNITLVDSNKKVYSDDDLDDLMEERLGFVLPLNYLHYWIQGVSLSNEPITAHLEDGFEQLGWKVEYLQWQDPNHPKIIQCSRNGTVIKLLINW